MPKTFCCSARLICVKALPSTEELGVFSWVSITPEETLELVPVLPYGIPLKNHPMIQCQFRWGNRFCIPAGFLPYYRHSEQPNVKLVRNTHNNSISVKSLYALDKSIELVFNHNEEKAIDSFY